MSKDNIVYQSTGNFLRFLDQKLSEKKNNSSRRSNEEKSTNKKVFNTQRPLFE